MTLFDDLVQVASKNLTFNQRKVARDLIYHRFLSPLLSKRTILILGCQRSGTTLTFLILNSHPKIRLFDETESRFDYPEAHLVWRNWIDGYFTGCKLPTKVVELEYIVKYFPFTKIIWPIRSPYSTIASMLALTNSQGTWIARCAKKELQQLTVFYPELTALDLDSLNEVFLGAYVWKYKNLALDLYRKSGLNVFAFRYEDLLKNSQDIGSKMLDFIGLDWSENLLQHEKHYEQNKQYAGKTRGDRAIDVSRQQPKLVLSERDREVIASICKNPMEQYAY